MCQVGKVAKFGRNRSGEEVVVDTEGLEVREVAQLARYRPRQASVVEQNFCHSPLVALHTVPVTMAHVAMAPVIGFVPQQATSHIVKEPQHSTLFRLNGAQHQ